MKLLEAAVDAILIYLLINYVRDRGMLDNLSPAMRTAVFVAILSVAFLTLNYLWATVTRAWKKRSGAESPNIR